MKKRILLIIIFFTIAMSIMLLITTPKKDKWIYKINDSYYIEKKSDTLVQLKKGNELIIKEYIGEFTFDDNYVETKCIMPGDTVTIIYYIVDIKKDIKYGPYNLEEYESVKKNVIDSKLNNWTETIVNPNNKGKRW